MGVLCNFTNIICILSLIGMVYFFVRFRLLCAALTDAKEQLEEITEQIGENRIVKLSNPGKELEGLLEAVNRALYQIRQDRLVYAKRERGFKEQIENISHDLRTPLTSMIGYLKIMDESGMNGEERENLRIVLCKSEALGRLITQFYEFSRLAADDYELRTERVDAARLLKETLADAYGALGAKHLKVAAELPGNPVFVSGDSSAMRRIFENLIGNAEKYAADSLLLSFLEEGEQAVFLFSNNTGGLSEDAAERLFERFYRADPARSSGSTGLGLTIARELAEKMGGSLKAEVRDGEWLTISCIFRKS